MTRFELHEGLERTLLIAVGLIPACMGVFAFLNNLSGWDETVLRVVYPMINMEGTFSNPAQTWRAVDSMALANTLYVFVFVIEGLFGLLALAGVVAMIRNFSASNSDFVSAIRIVRTACLIAVFVYGFFFFTTGGDWFLAWQNPDLDGLQQDAVNYSMIIIIAFVILDSGKRVR